MPTDRTTLELRNSKSAQTGPQAFEQVLASLPVSKSPLFGLRPKDPLSLEIVSVGQITTFQLNFSTGRQRYIVSQLTANYPEVKLSPVSPDNDSINHFSGTTTLSGYLKLAHADYFPLKTYHEADPNDPLAVILGNLSKLTGDHKALVQILVTRESESWKRAGTKAMEGKTSADGTHTPHPERPLIEKKLSQVSYLVSIKLAAAGPTPKEAKDILDTLAHSFAPFTLAKGNAFKFVTPKFRKKALTASLPIRTFANARSIHLSLSETATLYHFPFDKLKDIKNLAWGKTLLGEPPENLPYHHPDYQQHNKTVNFIGRTEFKNQQVTFGLKDEDRRRHFYVMGKTGTGKSTLLSNMIISDLKRGKGLAVIDPHGDLIETVLDFIPSSRINDVIYLNPADPDYAVKLNLLEAEQEEHQDEGYEEEPVHEE